MMCFKNFFYSWHVCFTERHSSHHFMLKPESFSGSPGVQRGIYDPTVASGVDLQHLCTGLVLTKQDISQSSTANCSTDPVTSKTFVELLLNIHFFGLLLQFGFKIFLVVLLHRADVCVWLKLYVRRRKAPFKWCFSLCWFRVFIFWIKLQIKYAPASCVSTFSRGFQSRVCVNIFVVFL